MTKLPIKRRAKTNKLSKKRTVSQAKKDAKKAFSKYIRLRDAIKTTGTKTHAKCCTCGIVQEISSMDAGHYSQAPHEATRFDERNVNAQCKRCNGLMDGEQVEYKHFMIVTYGHAVEREIWDKRRELKQWRVEELDAIRDWANEEYKKILKQKSYIKQGVKSKIKRGERI